MAYNPAEPLHPPAQLLQPTPLSYSAVAHRSPKTHYRPAEQAGSPGGWGAVDPTRAESESDDEEYDDEYNTWTKSVEAD